MKFRKIYNKIRYFIYKRVLLDCDHLVIKKEYHYPTLFLGKGKIHIEMAQLGVTPSPYFYHTAGYIEARNSSARVTIKDHTIINNSFVIIADKTSITIGEHCLIGPNLFITDSDFHGVEIKDRSNGNYQCLPVSIENHVFIGENVRILKGVTIGEGSVIGNSSVVTKSVPPYSIYAGNPAKLLKKLSSD